MIDKCDDIKVKCACCKRKVPKADNFCFGCHHVVCVRCCMKHGHTHPDGHWVPKNRPLAVPWQLAYT